MRKRIITKENWDSNVREITDAIKAFGITCYTREEWLIVNEGYPMLVVFKSNQINAGNNNGDERPIGLDMDHGLPFVWIEDLPLDTSIEEFAEELLRRNPNILASMVE